MGKFAGATFILGAITGFGFGLLPPTEEQATQQLASVARIVTEKTHVAVERPNRLPAEKENRAVPVRSPSRGEATAHPTIAQATGRAVQPLPPSPSRISSVLPGDEASRKALTKSIQTELRRVGCFEGDTDGSWSPATRKAMKAFTERVNATLPVEEPDYILLMLVQGHSGPACGAGCPAGQVLAKGDKCEPRAVVAQGRRASAPGSQAAVRAEQPARVEPPARVDQPAKEPLPGRMGAGAVDVATQNASRGEARDRIAALPGTPVGGDPTPAGANNPTQPASDSPNEVAEQPQAPARRADKPARAARAPKASVVNRAPPAPRAVSHASVFARLQLNAP